MKRLFVTAMLVVATASPFALAQQSAPSSEFPDVLQAYEAAEKAMLVNDEAGLNRYVAKNFLYVEISGALRTRDEFIKGLPSTPPEKQPHLKNERIVSLRAQGNNAVVVKNFWFSDGKKMNRTFTFTSVLAKQGEDWQVIMLSELRSSK